MKMQVELSLQDVLNDQFLSQKELVRGQCRIVYNADLLFQLLLNFSYIELVIYRFKQLKEKEKKKLSKALPKEEAQPLASVSDSDDGSDEESNDKVNIQLVEYLLEVLCDKAVLQACNSFLIHFKSLIFLKEWGKIATCICISGYCKKNLYSKLLFMNNLF